MIDQVTAIDSKTKMVSCTNRELSYDYLVVAVGAHKMTHPGIENTLSICGKPEESTAIKERLDALIAQGSGRIAMGFGGNPKDTTAVRGGPAFELLFNVHTQLKRKGIRDRFELTFFAPMESPGARMGDKALKMMDLFFKKLDIRKQFGKKIKGFEPEGVRLEDDSLLKSDFTMFIPAGNGHGLMVNSDLPLNEAGFVKVDDTGEVVFEGGESRGVFAVGDVAAIEGPAWRAKQGHIAEVMARNAAFNIAAMEKGSMERKGYKEHLNILCVMDSGDGAAFVYRDDKKGMMIPMPVVGHWLKKGWGFYYRNSKLNRFPRLPGM